MGPLDPTARRWTCRAHALQGSLVCAETSSSTNTRGRSALSAHGCCSIWCLCAATTLAVLEPSCCLLRSLQRRKGLLSYYELVSKGKEVGRDTHQSTGNIIFGSGALLEMLQPAGKSLSPLVQRVAAGGVWRAGSSEGLEIPFGAGDQARRLLAAWEQQGRAAGAAPGDLPVVSACQNPSDHAAGAPGSTLRKSPPALHLGRARLTPRLQGSS